MVLILGSGQSSKLIKYICTFNGCETMLYNYERITKMYIGSTKRIEIRINVAMKLTKSFHNFFAFLCFGSTINVDCH